MNLVSIIIPCHNYGWLLAETLDSVLAQTHQQWECLIIDDGSTDSTRAVAEKYQQADGRFRYIYQKNAGVSSARNNGLRQMRGQYTQFLDADDILDARKIELHLRYFERNPSADLVYGPVKYFDDGEFGHFRLSLDNSLQPWMPNVSGRGYDMVFHLVRNNIMVIQSPLVKNATFKETGYFNELLVHNEDWHLWLKCALVGMNFVFDDNPEAMSYVRVHKSSASQNQGKMLSGEKDMRMILRKELMSAQFAPIAQFNIERIIKINHQLGYQFFDSGSYLNGIHVYLQNATITGIYFENIRHIIHQFRRKLSTVF